ncbi:hypothetical protein ACFL59_11335 [Planctomycetota bacterium]
MKDSGHVEEELRDGHGQSQAAVAPRSLYREILRAIWADLATTWVALLLRSMWSVVCLARVLGCALVRPGHIRSFNGDSKSPAVDPVQVSIRVFRLHVTVVVLFVLLGQVGVMPTIRLTAPDAGSQTALAFLIIASQPLSIVLYLLGLCLVGLVGHVWALLAAPARDNAQLLSTKLIIEYNAIIFFLILAKVLLTVGLQFAAEAGHSGVRDFAGMVALGFLAVVAVHVVLFLRRVSLQHQGRFVLRWLSTPIAAALITAFFAVFAVVDSVLTLLQL